MKRQQLLRQQARRGPWGGEWGSWGQLEPEWVRRERAPGKSGNLAGDKEGSEGSTRPWR